MAFFLASALMFLTRSLAAALSITASVVASVVGSVTASVVVSVVTFSVVASLTARSVPLSSSFPPNNKEHPPNNTRNAMIGIRQPCFFLLGLFSLMFTSPPFTRSSTGIVVFLYTLLYTAFLGSLTKPIPFFSYKGLTDLFTARLALAVVRDLTRFLTLGLRTPTFIFYPSFLPHVLRVRFLEHQIFQNLFFRCALIHVDRL